MLTLPHLVGWCLAHWWYFFFLFRKKELYTVKKTKIIRMPLLSYLGSKSEQGITNVEISKTDQEAVEMEGSADNLVSA